MLSFLLRFFLDALMLNRHFYCNIHLTRNYFLVKTKPTLTQTIIYDTNQLKNYFLLIIYFSVF